VNCSTSNCQVKFDSVEQRRSYRLFNTTAYRFFSVKNVQAEMLFNFQKPVTRLLPMRHNAVLINSKLFCL